MSTAAHPGRAGPRSASSGAGARAAPSACTSCNLVLVLLTMVSACADAISFLGLGHVFPANMTGNTVLLGIGMATGDLSSAARSATALGAFLFGAAAVAAATPPRITASAALLVIAAEIAATAAFCGWWWGTGEAAPAGGSGYGLIALAGSAMGGQSALVRSLGVPAATTYITGTWTALSTGLATRRHRQDAPGTSGGERGAHQLQASVVGTYLLTAAGAAFAYHRLGAPATALALGIIVMAATTAAINRSALDCSLGDAAAS